MKQEYKLTRPYSKGPYNKIDKDVQTIRITEGCPHKHPFCAESFENPKFKVYELPEIVRNRVNILDMNLLCHKEALDIIKTLGRLRVNKKVVKYSLQCGVDYRFLTQELASALKQARFIDMRFAWDEGYNQVYKVWDAYKILCQAGYDPKTVECFMICNWRTPYKENCLKLDTLKVWGVMVAQCWFDNQVPPDIKPVYWTPEQIADFQHRCRDHSIVIRHDGIHPEKARKGFNITSDQKKLI